MNHQELSDKLFLIYFQIKDAIVENFKKNVPQGKEIRFNQKIPLEEGDGAIIGLTKEGYLLIDTNKKLDDVPTYIDVLMATLRLMEEKAYKII